MKAPCNRILAKLDSLRENDAGRTRSNGGFSCRKLSRDALHCAYRCQVTFAPRTTSWQPVAIKARSQIPRGVTPVRSVLPVRATGKCIAVQMTRGTSIAHTGGWKVLWDSFQEMSTDVSALLQHRVSEPLRVFRRAPGSGQAAMVRPDC